MSAVTLPLTFRAVGSDVSGPLESLHRTIAAVQADEVLVRVSFASLNAMDAKVYRTNMPKLPLPMVLGYDLSGVVVALGSSAPYPGEKEPLAVGSAVLGSTFAIGWGAGCFAEYALVKRERVALRGEIADSDAACYGLAYQGAYDSLCVVTDIRTRAGQTIFIPGGAGGVGHFAVQLAKAYGLRVIASASQPEGLALLRKLGADVVIDYSTQDVVQEVLKVTGGRGAELVFDATLAEGSFRQSSAVVASGGQWIRMGSWMQAPPALKAEVEVAVASRQATMLAGDLAKYALDPAFKAKGGLLLEGVALGRHLYAEGRVRPHIAQTLTLDATALQKALQSGSRSAGKVVVKVQ